MPANLIGWVIMPIGVAVTLWVLFKKIERDSFQCYIGLAVIWTLMAVVLDYFFVVKMLQPADGYYKLDVCLYYALTFLLPSFVGWYKMRKKIITPAS